jgi:hypothetical protein
MTDLKNSKVVKSTKKVGGLIQSGLERVGKTINNLNQIVIATQSGYERGEAIIKEEVATRLLLKGLEIDRDQAIKFYNKRYEKQEIKDEELKGILKEVNRIYDAREKIYNDRLETLKEDKDQLKSSYNELLAKTYREAAQRKLKQRQAEKTSNKDKVNRPKPTEIIGFICSFANVIISNIAIGNKKIETLVDDTITIIENATTKQDIEKAKLFRNNALIVIAANRKRLTTIQQVIDILNILAPLITPIVTFFKLNPIPSAVPPGVGVPLGTITTISDKTRKLQDIIDSSLSIVSVLSSVVSKLIDDLEYQESRLNQIGNILEQNLNNLSINDLNDLLLSSSQGLGYLSGYDYKGFKFYIKEENNPNFVVKGNKRRYATAVNKDGNDILQSSSSFTLEPDVLVEELKLQIDQKGLVA